MTPKLHAIFLFKLYLSNTFIDSKEVVNYFGLPPNTVQTIGTKILIDSDSTERSDNTIETINLSETNLNNDNEFTFISETLIAFNQILCITTIDLGMLIIVRQNKHQQASISIPRWPQLPHKKLPNIQLQHSPEQPHSSLTIKKKKL